MNKRIIFPTCLLMAMVWSAGCSCLPPAPPPPPPPPVVEPLPPPPPPPAEVVKPQPPMEQPVPSKKLKQRVIRDTD